MICNGGPAADAAHRFCEPRLLAVLPRLCSRCSTRRRCTCSTMPTSSSVLTSAPAPWCHISLDLRLVGVPSATASADACSNVGVERARRQTLLSVVDPVGGGRCSAEAMLDAVAGGVPDPPHRDEQRPALATSSLSSGEAFVAP